MNILFLTLLDFDNIEERNIYTDLLRKFYQEGHDVYVVSPVERKKHINTKCLNIDKRLSILKLRIGNIQKTNLIEKGISTITLERKFISAIRKYYAGVKFDLVLYSTPPITLQKAVNYVKNRDDAVTYLMLKDIFPQNAVDMGMLTTKGLKGILYRYFRNKEKKLYRDSDYIGCMSKANVNYVRKHNRQVNPAKVEICPNSIEPTHMELSVEDILKIRKKYGIPESKKVLIYGGNLGKPQGIPYMMQCIKKVKDIEDCFFLIVGSGTEYNEIEAFIHEEGLKNVKLYQYLPKEEYDRLVRASDIGLIFLDYRFTIPNFPSRLLAYMDAGLPVFALTDKNTDIGKVIIKKNFGWWCESRSVKEFEKTVHKILRTDEKEIKMMSDNAKKVLLDMYNVDRVYKIITEKISG